VVALAGVDILVASARRRVIGSTRELVETGRTKPRARLRRNDAETSWAMSELRIIMILDVDNCSGFKVSDCDIQEAGRRFLMTFVSCQQGGCAAGNIEVASAVHTPKSA
jgi:hypothetical protein